MQLRTLTLPDEILLHIIDGIDRKVIDGFAYLDKSTLCVLCLASRKLCDITRPMLYRSFSHRGQADWPDHRSLRPFKRTLISRPDLAALVKHVNVICIGQDTDIDSDLEQRSSLTNVSATRWTEWVVAKDAELNSIRDNLWPDFNLEVQVLKHNFGHSTITNSIVRTSPSKLEIRRAQEAILLLHLLPNTRTLELLVTSDATELGEVLVGLNDTARSQLLPDLDTIEFLFFHIDTGFGFGDVVSLLQRPNLKKLRALNALELEEQANHIETQLMLPIEEYDLGNCVMTHTALASLINATRHLKVLSLDCGPVALDFLGRLDLDTIHNALALHCRWLSSFRLVFPNHLLNKTGFTVTGRLDFRDMEVLQNLEVSEHFLLGDDDERSPRLVDTIPRNLRSLKLRDTTERILPHIQEYISLKDEKFPALDLQIVEGEDKY